MRPRNIARELAVLAWYRDFMEENDYSPTMQQIADVFGVSVSTVHKDMHRLVADGRLKGFRGGERP